MSKTRGAIRYIAPLGEVFMAQSYIVDIRNEYKDWISKESIMTDKPMYLVFESILLPYYNENYGNESIPKVSFKQTEISRLVLSAKFKQILKLEAHKKGRITIISLVDTIFRFYLENH